MKLNTGKLHGTSYFVHWNWRKSIRSQFILFMYYRCFLIDSTKPEICNKVYRNVSTWDLLLSLISKGILLFVFLYKQYEPNLTSIKYSSSKVSCRLQSVQKKIGNGEICIIAKFIISRNGFFNQTLLHCLGSTMGMWTRINILGYITTNE